MRGLAIFVALISQSLLASASQATSGGKSASISCAFDDGKEIKIQYNSSSAKHGEEFREGKLWEPGGSPMILFTQTALTLANSLIPEGAYSLYVIPEKQKWTLILNKSVTPSNKYDAAQDLVRAPMPTGEIEQALKQPKLAFAHIAAKQCNLRLYYENTGGWAEFREK
jgi:Protein of unknown function (DUF2911)